MNESLIQENRIVESRLNFPIAFTTLPKTLVVVENISSKKKVLI
jgi:hypothetical protein